MARGSGGRSRRRGGWQRGGWGGEASDGVARGGWWRKISRRVAEDTADLVDGGSEAVACRPSSPTMNLVATNLEEGEEGDRLAATSSTWERPAATSSRRERSSSITTPASGSKRATTEGPWRRGGEREAHDGGGSGAKC